jgi:hypothetical protein
MLVWLFTLWLIHPLQHGENFIQNINQIIRKDSPYGGTIELRADQIIHRQIKNPGTRIVTIADLDSATYAYDRYDPFKAYHSVELKCKEGNCVRIEWIDGEVNSYPALIFAFKSERSALRVINLFNQFFRQ